MIKCSGRWKKNGEWRLILDESVLIAWAFVSGFGVALSIAKNWNILIKFPNESDWVQRMENSNMRSVKKKINSKTQQPCSSRHEYLSSESSRGVLVLSCSRYSRFNLGKEASEKLPQTRTGSGAGRLTARNSNYFRFIDCLKVSKLPKKRKTFARTVLSLLLCAFSSSCQNNDVKQSFDCLYQMKSS